MTMNFKKYLLFFCFVIPIITVSCLKKVPVETAQTKISDIERKQQLLGDKAPEFFDKLEDSNLSVDEKKYLEFLIAYMPISDFADYEVEFFLRHVKFSIDAKNTFPWCSDIPENIFMHYVLSPRINNENMDTARMVFFRELKERLLEKEYTMEEAALEVNHWCHEKVVYRGTDERTIGPLSVIRSAFGRCGEESTFTTTALRSAGIPARQVYTPRWAHTDDNHAWVEVWIDGEWKYLGACEPAPVLNTGWFDVPASRAMLVHTKQFGFVEGEKYTPLSKTENYAWVNALDTYTKTKKLVVRVVDENNLPVWNAQVRFQIYNYAEMYPIYKTVTDIKGLASFETGFGSLEVYVTDGDNISSVLVNPSDEGWVTVVLDEKNDLPSTEIEYTPPSAASFKPVDADLTSENEKRLKQEDVIRTKYVNTFYKPLDAEFFAETFKYPVEIADYLLKSRGNWSEIEAFLIESSYLKKQKWAFELIKVIAEKDLRDSKNEILSDHLNFALKYKSDDISEDIFVEYVLNPRVKFEKLTAYRNVIIEKLTDEQIIEFQNNPEKIKSYVNEQIKTTIESEGETIKVSELNEYKVPISPAGVSKIGLADEESYKVYFVAFCRSLGVPARIDVASGYPQYFHNGFWYDAVSTSNQQTENIKRGKLQLISGDISRSLKYRIHFSIAKLDDGIFNTVDLGWEIPITNFSDGIELPLGYYMLLTSLRKEDGSVLVNREYFVLNENETLRLNVRLPEIDKSENLYETFNHTMIQDQNLKVVSSANMLLIGDYVAYVWLDPNKEPSKHIVRDLTPMISELRKNKITVCFITNQKNFVPGDYGYSDELNFCYDDDYNLLYSNLKCSISGDGIVFPQILLVNKKNKIVFSSAGYTIAVGELFLNNIKK